MAPRGPMLPKVMQMRGLLPCQASKAIPSGSGPTKVWQASEACSVLLHTSQPWVCDMTNFQVPTASSYALLQTHVYGDSCQATASVVL